MLTGRLKKAYIRSRGEKTSLGLYTQLVAKKQFLTFLAQSHLVYQYTLYRLPASYFCLVKLLIRWYKILAPLIPSDVLFRPVRIQPAGLHDPATLCEITCGTSLYVRDKRHTQGQMKESFVLVRDIFHKTLSWSAEDIQTKTAFTGNKTSCSYAIHWFISSDCARGSSDLTLEVLQLCTLVP